jgi:hypothetical protein
MSDFEMFLLSQFRLANTLSLHRSFVSLAFPFLQDDVFNDLGLGILKNVSRGTDAAVNQLVGSALLFCFTVAATGTAATKNKSPSRKRHDHEFRTQPGHTALCVRS